VLVEGIPPELGDPSAQFNFDEILHQANSLRLPSKEMESPPLEPIRRTEVGSSAGGMDVLTPSKKHMSRGEKMQSDSHEGQVPALRSITDISEIEKKIRKVASKPPIDLDSVSDLQIDEIQSRLSAIEVTIAVVPKLVSQISGVESVIAQLRGDVTEIATALIDLKRILSRADPDTNTTITGAPIGADQPTMASVLSDKVRGDAIARINQSRTMGAASGPLEKTDVTTVVSRRVASNRRGF
jgi:hypothetical protein